MQKLGPGMYADGAGALHVHLNEIYELTGLDPSPENDAVIEQEIIAGFLAGPPEAARGNIPTRRNPRVRNRRPGYWRDEQSGILAPVVRKFMACYLTGNKLTAAEVPVMRAYLRQWIHAPAWKGAGLEALQAAVGRIRTHEDIEQWLKAAADLGIDPL